MARRCRLLKTFLFLAFLSFAYEISLLLVVQETLFPIDPRKEESFEFSACLLFNDDTHFLDEWIAFHWTTLPLRRLILAVDPLSQSSPNNMLKDWQNILNISVWEDDDYFDRVFRSGILRDTKLNTSSILINLHRQRQKIFYWKCIQQLKEEKRNWVAFIDIDELLFPNKIYWKFRNLLKEGHSENISTLFHRLRKYKPISSSPCIPVPRILFGGKEEGEESNRLSLYPIISSIQKNTSDFMSLRWRWHAGPDHELNKAGKGIIDISRVPRDLLEELNNINVHRPIKPLCAESAMWHKVSDSPIVLHHYVGTADQWLYRDDVRGTRTENAYQVLLEVNNTQDITTHRWLDDFVENVGVEQATILLKGVGKVGDASSRNTKSLGPEERLEKLLTLLYKKKKTNPFSIPR